MLAGFVAATLAVSLLHAKVARAADPQPPADRASVVQAWQYGRTQVREAAEKALVGSDVDVRAFLNGGWQQAQRLDERDAVVAVIADAGPAVRSAAEAALDAADAGDQNAISSFLSTGWQHASDIDARVQVNQLMSAGGDQVKQAAQQALDSTDPAVWREFVDSGWQSRWMVDQRVRVNQAMSAGGPEVKAAAQKALSAATPEAYEAFLDYGWSVAAARDQETSALDTLVSQAQAQGDTAAQETQRAKDEAAKAHEAAEAARKAAEAAAAATNAARSDTAQAAAQAKRAAVAAQQAAAAAKVAVQAAASAQRAAGAAANAAQRAAAAASQTEAAATRAYNAAADAARDGSKASDAMARAQDARYQAQSATRYSQIADQAGQAVQAALDAVDAAKAAGADAQRAGTANDDAARYANAAGADASESVTAANQARADADRAARAADAAHNYLVVARDAAFASRDAANRAAADAQAAANAAVDAANHAGDAAQAAQRASDAAAAATVAANAAVNAAGQAMAVFNAARDADAQRIAVARDEAEDAARTALTQYQAQQQAAKWDAVQAEQRDAETNRLLAEAQNANTDPALAVADGRRVALNLTHATGTWTRQAAIAALGGSDAQVMVYVQSGVADAAGQDDRVTLGNIAVTDNTKLRDAALAALNGSDAEVAAFLHTQNYPGRYVDDRVKVNQIMSGALAAGDAVVAQRAQDALHAGTDQAFRDFIGSGQYTAAAVGQRVGVNQVMSAGGPEVQAAAQVALDGPPTAWQQFLDEGQYAAAERDQDAAAHLATVAGLVQQINQTAQTAVQNAMQAQASAAQARNDAGQAANYANQAAQAAQTAAGYATQAQQYANQAAQSVDKAAAAVQTAKDAATRADASARSAVRSAAWAIVSHDTAVQTATQAQASALQAYYSALGAGYSASVAAGAASQALKSYEDAKGLELGKCRTEYADGPAEDLEKALSGTQGDWYKNCVANVIANPDELARRAYENSAWCSLYPDGSDLYNNCMNINSVLAPDFTGMQALQLAAGMITGALALYGAMLAPAGVLCAVTVACGATVGTLLTITDVGLNIYKLINGDQSLSTTLLHLGETGLQALLFAGLGKLVSAGFRLAKDLYEISRAAKAAEAELKGIDLAIVKLKRPAACLTGGNSFTPDTPVLLADHTSKPIADIRVGDPVLATDPGTYETAGEVVTGVITSTDTGLTDLAIGQPGGRALVLHTTPHHPFWAPDIGRWIDAEQLTPGTALRTPEGNTARVDTVHTHLGRQTMINLSVSTVHTYYVLAGNTPVLVHNTSCWSIDDDELDAIFDHYGPAVTQGVEYQIARYNEGATDHALNGIGTDVNATAAYLGAPRNFSYIDITTGNRVAYDSANQILIIRTPQDIHAYNYSQAAWDANVGTRYVEPPAGGR